MDALRCEEENRLLARSLQAVEEDRTQVLNDLSEQIGDLEEEFKDVRKELEDALATENVS